MDARPVRLAGALHRALHHHQGRHDVHRGARAIARLDAPADGQQAPAAGIEVVAEPRWYALHTRSRHEKRVRIELTGRPGIEPFLPLYRRFSWWGDRTKQIEVPLFPGYCFARFRYAERLPVLRTFGVVALVGLTDRPEWIPDGEIEAIRTLIESKVRYDPHPFLEEGDQVEVVHGPLKGTRGLLIRKDRAERVVLSVGLIRRSVAVQIHAADVRRI